MTVYPCYKKTHSCESTDGTVLIDPFDDLLYITAESYIVTTNLISKLIGILPEHRQLEKEEKLIRYIRDWGTTMKPLSNVNLRALDTLRFRPYDHIGGSLYNNINDPTTGNTYYINSKKGQKILKSYIKYNKF